jgi:hypothetical protein
MSTLIFFNFINELIQSVLKLIEIVYPEKIKLPPFDELFIFFSLLSCLILISTGLISLFLKFLIEIALNFLKSNFFILKKNKYYIFMLQYLNNLIIEKVCTLRSFIIYK